MGKELQRSKTILMAGVISMVMCSILGHYLKMPGWVTAPIVIVVITTLLSILMWDSEKFEFLWDYLTPAFSKGWIVAKKQFKKKKENGDKKVSGSLKSETKP